MKGELCRKIINEFMELRAKTCSYLMDDNNESKKEKSIKLCYKKKT